MEEAMFKKFADMTLKSLSESEKKVLGLDKPKRTQKQLDESYVKTVTDHTARINGKGKDSGDVSFAFEDANDAQDVFDFFMEHGLLNPGEITLEEGTVSFTPSVLDSKPELIQAVMIAYEDLIDLSEDGDEDRFESFVGEMGDLLNEITTSGAGSMKGNPFHGKGDGKFTSPSDHMASKGGSWSDGRRKLKFTGSGKDKKGGAMAKYGSTKHPCGRAARAVGKDTRCWDGTDLGGGRAVGKSLKKVKRRNESLSLMDKAFLMEMRAKYRRMSSSL